MKRGGGNWKEKAPIEWVVAVFFSLKCLGVWLVVCCRLMVTLNMWCCICVSYDRWWMIKLFILKLLMTFGDGWLGEMFWWEVLVNDRMMCRINGGVEQAKQLRILDFEFGFWECMSRIEKQVKFFWRWKCNLCFSLYYWWVYGRNAHTKCFWTELPPISFHCRDV